MPRAVSLLPCPCCGAEAQMQYAHVPGLMQQGGRMAFGSIARAVCSCGMRTANQHADTDSEAAALAAAIWNRREWMPDE